MTGISGYYWVLIVINAFTVGLGIGHIFAEKDTSPQSLMSVAVDAPGNYGVIDLGDKVLVCTPEKES